MNISFLGQGFEDQSVNAIGHHLIAFLNRSDFHTFYGISAFASESGIYGLTGHLNSAKQYFKSLNLIIGVDLEGTSKEALEELLGIGINSYVYYQKEQPIFHPKIYLFEGSKEIKLIIGSSNLTRGGLFTNVESSILIEFDSSDKGGLALLREIKTYYKTLFDFSDPNLFPINNSVIMGFYANGIIPTEKTRSTNFKKSVAPPPPTTSSTNTLAIPWRKTAKVPSTFPAKPRKAVITPTTTAKALQTHANPIPTTPPVQLQPKTLVWQKPSLSSSDAQQVLVGTKITGNLKLSQAKFMFNNILIDQTTYFRNQVFGNLAWAHTKTSSSSYEEVLCRFQITILGKVIGTFLLKLSHDPVRVASQGNTPTWLHWGNTILPFLQQTNIKGKTLNLYRLNQAFFIEIV